jgi:hypothetical protein
MRKAVVGAGYAGTKAACAAPRSDDSTPGAPAHASEAARVISGGGDGSCASGNCSCSSHSGARGVKSGSNLLSTAVPDGISGRQRPWSEGEDSRLRTAVRQLGEQDDWGKVAEIVATRTPLQCAHRWRDTDLVKGKWSLVEDELLSRMVRACVRARVRACCGHGLALVAFVVRRVRRHDRRCGCGCGASEAHPCVVPVGAIVGLVCLCLSGAVRWAFAVLVSCGCPPPPTHTCCCAGVHLYVCVFGDR